MATIIIKNSTGSGVVPSSLVQGELAINTKDGRLFYGSGSGNVVKEFTGSGGGGTTFPYTGSAAITGSLTITGSLEVQTSGQKSISTTDRELYDSNGYTTVFWDTGTLNSGSNQNTSVDWFNRALYDSFTTSSVDWEGRVLYDSSTVTCIDWSGRNLADSTGVDSVQWEGRILRTPGNVRAFIYNNDYVVGSQIYQSQTIELGSQEQLSNNILTYSGQAIFATIDNSSNAGELVYLSGSNIWYPINQTTDTSTNMLGINIDGINVLLEGDIVLDNVDGTTFGAPLYIQEGGVILSKQIPSSGYVRVLGHLYYQNTTTLTNYIVKFRPSNDWYEI